MKEFKTFITLTSETNLDRRHSTGQQKETVVIASLKFITNSSKSKGSRFLSLFYFTRVT